MKIYNKEEKKGTFNDKIQMYSKNPHEKDRPYSQQTVVLKAG